MDAERKYKVVAYIRDESKDKPGLFTFEEAVVLKGKLDATDPDTFYMIEDIEEAE